MLEVVLVNAFLCA